MAPRFIIKEEKSVDEESEGAPKGVYQGKGCIEGKGVPRRAEGCTKARRRVYQGAPKGVLLQV